MSEQLDVHIYGTRIGRLTRGKVDRVDLTASRAGIERFGLNSRVLSMNLPLTTMTQDATAFIGGLLPEGIALANLRRQIGPARQSLFDLVSYVGRDVAGAITFGEPQPIADHLYIPLTDAEVAARLDAAATLPLGRIAGGTSLTGYQRKITLAWHNGQWCDSEGGAVSTHILKPVEAEREKAIRSEGYALALGRHMGLLQHDSYVTDFAGRPTLVIERYDRVVYSDGHVDRVHQEDSAQALGLAWDSETLKFQHTGGVASYRAVAGLLPRKKSVFDDAAPDLDQLARYMTFNVAIGNTDAHAKNFSLLHSAESSTTLAPLYDVIPQALGYDSQQTLALWVNGVHDYADVTADDLVREASSWGIPMARARLVVTNTLLRLESAVLATPAHELIRETVPGYILGQSYNLLAGRRGRLDLPHPLGLLTSIPLPARPTGIAPALPAGMP